MRVHGFLHVSYETLGCIEPWAHARGHELSFTRWFAGERSPDDGAVDLLIVMGGPMNVHDEAEHPWLGEEKRFLDRAIARRIPILGICLGAQLLADRLGAAVTRMPHKEIGWFPLRRGDPLGPGAPVGPSPRVGPRAPLGPSQPVDPFTRLLPEGIPVFHWHGEMFDIPAGAMRLAESDACPNQAFVHGDRRLGLQFHLEMTRDGAAEIIAHCEGRLVPGPTVQSGEAMLADPARFDTNHAFMAALLDRLAAIV